MSRIRLLAAGAAAALAPLAPPALASAETVATPGAPTAVREFSGTIVFSQFASRRTAGSSRSAGRERRRPSASLSPRARARSTPTSGPTRPDGRS
jgi:hypothetical protein